MYVNNSSFNFTDPHIKVAGLPESVRQAKEKVMAVLDTKVYYFD